MSNAVSLALLPLAIGLMIGGMALVKIVAGHYGWSAEIQRKLVHVSTGLFAMALPWLLPQALLFYLLLALTVCVMLVLRTPAISVRGVGSALHGVERKSWGDLMLVAAVATLYFFSDGANNAILYLLPLAVLTLSDAAAALAGSSYGRIEFSVEEGHKTIEGSTVFFLITLILSMVMLLLVSDIGRENVVFLSLMTAAFATVVEADSWRGFDNYFVPVGVLFLLSVHSDSSVAALLLLASGFLATVVVLRTYGGSVLGFSDHTARAYTAAIFMISAVTQLQNLVLPVALLIVHALARTARPCDAKHPDLDMLAVLATISFSSLIGGAVLDHTAISFYQVVCAMMVIQLIMLALSKKTHMLRYAAFGLSVAALLAATLFVISLNGAVSAWHRDMALYASIGLIFSGAVSLFNPQLYDRKRHLKLGLISFLPMLLAYIIEIYFAGGLA